MQSIKTSSYTGDLTKVGVPKKKTLFAGSIISGNFSGNDDGVISYSLECGMKNAAGILGHAAPKTDADRNKAVKFTKREWLNKYARDLETKDILVKELLLDSLGLKESSNSSGISYSARDTALNGSVYLVKFMKATNTTIDLRALKDFKLSVSSKAVSRVDADGITIVGTRDTEFLKAGRFTKSKTFIDALENPLVLS